MFVSLSYNQIRFDICFLSPNLFGELDKKWMVRFWDELKKTIQDTGYYTPL